MIKNERQYRITRTWADRFSQALLELKSAKDAGQLEVHPLLLQAQQDAMRSQLADLEAELREYEALKAGDFEFDKLGMIVELQELLIKARIARGLRQRDLAHRLGLKEQQIQRYEATEYASASLARIRDVVAALGVTGEEAEMLAITDLGSEKGD